MMRHLPLRWEQGSEFHWLDYQSDGKEATPWSDEGLYFGTGRDAFRALLYHGMSARRWRRLWIPSYFCQEVVSSLASTGIETAVYPDSPMMSMPDIEQICTRPGDVILIVNFFGLRGTPGQAVVGRHGVEIIEDHTHDPSSHWAMTSSADWCVVSLRKTLPIPDGAVLWSPSGHTMPPAIAPTGDHAKASLEKLAAMTLKALYLNAHAVKKDDFRRLAVAAEERIGTGIVSGMFGWTRSILPTFPVSRWRQHRRRNHEALCNALSGISWLTALKPKVDQDMCPYSGVLLLDTAGRREYLRQRLIDLRIYTAVLWPLDEPAIEGIPQEHVDTSRRMISVYCDMRYDEHDMEYVASLIADIGSSYRSETRSIA